MTADEFRAWLETLVGSERIDREQAADLALQREIFDERRSALVDEYAVTESQDMVVGYQHGEELTARSIPELLEQARRHSAYWLVYFEPIGFDPFGGAY